jgi:hypothetical protein
MAKVVVITDSEGHVVGSIRADPIETEDGTLQFQTPNRTIQSPEGTELRYHEIDVPEHLLDNPPESLHRELGQRVK